MNYQRLKKNKKLFLENDINVMYVRMCEFQTIILF